MSSSINSQLTVVDEERFRRTCAQFATGIVVATIAGSDTRPMGITINSFTSVSCAPPLVLVCVDYRSSILPHFRNSTHYGINVLNENQRDVSVRFSHPELDQFVGIAWKAGSSGVPLLDGVLATMECHVTQTVEAGDHAIFIAEVVSADSTQGRPLVYFGSNYCSFNVLRPEE